MKEQCPGAKMTEKKKAVRMSHISFALMLEELLRGPSTTKALSEHTGMDHRYINRFINTLHAKKLVHISGYQRDCLGRTGIREFALGPGEDAKSAPMSRQERDRLYRAKVRGQASARRVETEWRTAPPWTGYVCQAR